MRQPVRRDVPAERVQEAPLGAKLASARGRERAAAEATAAHGIRLSFQVPERRPCLFADPRLLRQAVANLVSNGIKFTQAGGAVTVSCGLESDGSYKIMVEDTGVGIAKENLTKVLEPFVQVESAYSRRYAGTGLGLPLVRKIVELHDGKVDLRSKLGLGTAVTARFPAARVRPAADHNIVHLAASA